MRHDPPVVLTPVEVPEPPLRGADLESQVSYSPVVVRVGVPVDGDGGLDDDARYDCDEREEDVGVSGVQEDRVEVFVEPHLILSYIFECY